MMHKIIVLWSLYWGTPIWPNCHISFASRGKEHHWSFSRIDFAWSALPCVLATLRDPGVS